MPTTGRVFRHTSDFLQSLRPGELPGAATATFSTEAGRNSYEGWYRVKVRSGGLARSGGSPGRGKGREQDRAERQQAQRAFEGWRARKDRELEAEKQRLRDMARDLARKKTEQKRRQAEQDERHREWCAQKTRAKAQEREQERARMALLLSPDKARLAKARSEEAVRAWMAGKREQALQQRELQRQRRARSAREMRRINQSLRATFEAR